MLRFALFVAIAATSSVASADPIVYTFRGADSSGVIGTTSFTDALFVARFFGDTNDVQSTPTGFRNATLFGTIEIETVGQFLFSDPMRVFVNNNNKATGWGYNPQDVLNGLNNDVFDTYDLANEIGPVADDTINIVGNPVTSGGTLVFTSVSGMSFQATSVPEPSAMGVIGLLGLVSVARRKRHWR